MGKELVQTKSHFSLRGKITGMGNTRFPSYDEGVSTKGKSKGKGFRKLNFGIQTSSTNLINVGMYEFEKEDAYLYKKGEKGEKGTTKKVPFSQWDRYKDEGFACLEFKIGYEFDDKGKVVEHSCPAYLATKLIDEEFTNGDFVYATGTIEYSKGEAPDGSEVIYTNYKLKSIKKIDELDFEAEDFKEISNFQQELVFVDALVDKRNNQVVINGRVVDYKQDFIDIQLPIKYANEDGEIDEDLKTLAGNFANKKAKFGDVINFFGNVWNKASVVTVDDGWGGKTKTVGGKREKSVEVLGIVRDKEGKVMIQQKLYSQKDFDDAVKSKQLVVETKNTESDWFGGKTDDDNPFANMGGKIDITEDDIDELPF